MYMYDIRIRDYRTLDVTVGKWLIMSKFHNSSVELFISTPSLDISVKRKKGIKGQVKPLLLIITLLSFKVEAVVLLPFVYDI